MAGGMEDKRHPGAESRERTDFSEETRSLDSFVVAPPRVSEPVAQNAAGADAYDFDD